MRVEEFAVAGAVNATYDVYILGMYICIHPSVQESKERK